MDDSFGYINNKIDTCSFASFADRGHWQRDSVSLCFDALPFVFGPFCVPRSRCIIFAKSHAAITCDLTGLIAASKDLYSGLGASYSTVSSEWTFPSGGRVTFCVFPDSVSINNYIGLSLTWVGFLNVNQLDRKILFSLIGRLGVSGGRFVSPLSRDPFVSMKCMCKKITNESPFATSQHAPQSEEAPCTE